MASRQQRTRVLRATKAQVANQLQSIRPGLTGAQIANVGKSDDSTFWFAAIRPGFSAFNGIEQELQDDVEFDSEFLVTNLLSVVDNTITADQILDLRISPADSTKIEISLRKARI